MLALYVSNVVSKILYNFLSNSILSKYACNVTNIACNVTNVAGNATNVVLK